MKRKRPPMQPIGWDGKGVVRFQKNVVVDALLNAALLHGGYGLNELRFECRDAPRSDWEQFAQLIGYSVSGFGDLSYARKSTVQRADQKAAELEPEIEEPK